VAKIPQQHPMHKPMSKTAAWRRECRKLLKIDGFMMLGNIGVLASFA
jgi:hypothetical protein